MFTSNSINYTRKASVMEEVGDGVPAVSLASEVRPRAYPFYLVLSRDHRVVLRREIWWWEGPRNPFHCNDGDKTFRSGVPFPAGTLLTRRAGVLSSCPPTVSILQPQLTNSPGRARRGRGIDPCRPVPVRDRESEMVCNSLTNCRPKRRLPDQV